MSGYRSSLAAYTLVGYTDRLSAEMDRRGYHRRAKAYRTACGRLCGFAGIDNLSYEHITPSLLLDFQHSLRSEGLSMNTISFYMRTLRSIYHKAISDGCIPRREDNLFEGVYTGVPPTRKRSLNRDELSVLSAFDPTTVSAEPSWSGRSTQPVLPDHLGQSLAMFLFCYHARGMCFIDMANLKKSDLSGDVLRYRRHKTGQSIELKVLPAMRRIIDWFAPLTADLPYLFPVISAPDKDPRLQYESGLRLQNLRLKTIARYCDLPEQLSTHVARHSWATVARNAGLPLAVISEGLGHANQHTTEIYLASLERSVIDLASMMVSDAIDLIRPHRPKRVGRHTLSGPESGVVPGSLLHAVPDYAACR